jgi:hypothetical protein
MFLSPDTFAMVVLFSLMMGMMGLKWCTPVRRAVIVTGSR